MSPLVESFAQNTIAAFITAIITNPLYVINTRMASLPSDNKINNFDMINLIFNNEGAKGFFKGLLPSLILIINPIIQFTIYDSLERLFKGQHPHKNLKNMEIVIMSFVSKFITTVVTYPITTFKTIKMSNSHSSTSNKNISFFDILRKHGLMSLYKGFLSKIIGSEVNSIIMMLTFENTRQIIKNILIKSLFLNSIK